MRRAINPRVLLWFGLSAAVSLSLALGLHDALLTVANLAIIALAFRHIGRQEALRGAEARFRGTFEAAAVGMAVIASDGRWLAVNSSLCATLGYAEHELLASDFQSITHRDDLATEREQMRRLEAGELSSYRREKRFIHQAGHLVHVVLSVSLVRHDASWPLHFVALIEDITARKRAEARLAAQYAVALVLADSSSLDVAIPRLLKAIGEALDFSGGEYWQLDPASGTLVAAEQWWISDRLDPAFRTASRRQIFSCGERLQGQVWSIGRPVVIEDVTRDPGCVRAGAARSVGLRGAVGLPVIGEEGMLGVMIFLSHDVATADDALQSALATLGRQIGLFVERWRAEDTSRDSDRRFRAIFDQTYAFIGLLDPEGTLLEANRAALDFAGVAREDVVGRPFWEGPWWKDSSAARDHLKASILGAAGRGRPLRGRASRP